MGRSKRPKKITVSTQKKKLDTIFSEYIRLRDAKELGHDDKALCFTCCKMFLLKELQAGHYIPRQHNSTRYHEKNVHSQCISCNIFKKGCMDIYALALQSRYGKEILYELNTLKNTLKSFTIPELDEMIDLYKNKLNELKGG